MLPQTMLQIYINIDLDTFSEACFLLARGKRKRLKSGALSVPGKDALAFLGILGHSGAM